jgi:hypothetical protein
MVFSTLSVDGFLYAAMIAAISKAQAIMNSSRDNFLFFLDEDLSLSCVNFKLGSPDERSIDL